MLVSGKAFVPPPPAARPCIHVHTCIELSPWYCKGLRFTFKGSGGLLVEHLKHVCINLFPPPSLRSKAAQPTIAMSSNHLQPRSADPLIFLSICSTFALLRCHFPSLHYAEQNYSPRGASMGGCSNSVPATTRMQKRWTLRPQ